MRGGKVRPGGTLQEEPLTFGGAEQPCDQRLKGRALSLGVNGVFVMYTKCSQDPENGLGYSVLSVSSAFQDTGISSHRQNLVWRR